MSDASSPNLSALFEARRHVFIGVLTRRLGSREDAEDVFQDALLKFYRAHSERDIDNPEAYLMKVALNLATDRMRQRASAAQRDKKWSADVLQFDGIIEPSSPADGVERGVIAREEFGRLLEGLQQLSPNVRESFMLHKINGMSQSETASKLGLSRSTVEKHIIKAMRFLLQQRAADE